jgi:succinoglycan biosynthesis transport protein ExoP
MDSRVVRRYLRIILRWWWLLVVSAVIPIVISYHFASQQPDLYQAKVTLMVGAGLQNPNPESGQIDLGNTLANAYAELARQGPIAEAVIERLGLEITRERLVAQIGTQVYWGAQLLEIQVTDTNPEAAALIANTLADELIRRSPASGGSDPEQQEFIRRQLDSLRVKIEDVSDEIDELVASLSELTSAAEIQEAQDRIAALEDVKSTYQSTFAGLMSVYQAESPNFLSLFEPASVPQSPVPGKTRLIIAVAGMAGIGLALGAIFLMEYLDTSLQWEGKGEQSILELPVLGAIPQVSRKDTLLSDSPLSPVAGGIRALRSNLYLMRPGQSFRTLLLTSPGASEGKSSILVNLAIVLASAGNRVIVVDADMRRPRLHELLDRPNVVGLADTLSNHQGDEEDSFSIPLQETGFDNLYLLSAGRPPADPAALLTSPRFSKLLVFLKDHGDVILLDSPPVLSAPDATVIATQVDGTILVGSVGLTKRELVRQARDRLLAQQSVNLLGLTVNRAKLDGSYLYYGPDRKDKGLKKVDSDDAFLTLGEAAARLGISKDQARRWCKSGRLPAVRKWLLWWRIDPDEIKGMVEDTWEIKTET